MTGRENAGKPIFKKILIPVIILVTIEILLVVGSIFAGGVFSHLDQNAKDILAERVINRKSYLENEIVNTWSQLELTAQSVNEATERMISEGTLSAGELDDSSSRSLSLMREISADLISMMRSNRVTGVFIVLNSDDLRETDEPGRYRSKPGIYLRDLDPAANPAKDDQDLLIERAPIELVEELNFSTDSGWQPQFEFQKMNMGYYDFLYQPYQAAYENEREGFLPEDFGYWSMPYCLEGDDKQAVSYSIPLILDDGTIYGVLGVDLTLDYLRRNVPFGELAEEKVGSYILAVTEKEDMSEQNAETVFTNVLVNGAVYSQVSGIFDETRVEDHSGEMEIHAENETFYCTVEYLNLYNTNTPFESQRWALIGAVRTGDLFAFSGQIKLILLAVVLFTLLVGTVGSFAVSKKISRPVEAVSGQIGKMDGSTTMAIPRTGIQEIDLLEASIENLSREAFDSATKFTQIICLASVKLAGFELNREERKLFITDGFFDMFNMKEIDTRLLTIGEFKRLTEKLEQSIVKEEEREILYRIPTEEDFNFVKLKYADDGICCIGLAEDVTETVTEKGRIEYERDHDLLTGLINRRAFSRTIKELFDEKRTSLKYAALVMLDLDNLKNLNDTYGHDCGDLYIRAAAECFRDAAPENALVARISGDEFYVFFYGYDTKEEVRERIERLKEGISKKQIPLPNSRLQKIAASGGIAWYPGDSTSYEELLKFSDFAMYKVKQSRKGEMGDFDIGVYNREVWLLQNKAELSTLIEKALVQYHFQPIIDVRTGDLFAYEALMRAKMPTLQSPDEIIALAKMESKLDQIERLTWFKALETYADHVESGRIGADCKLFVNSIASQIMTSVQITEFETRFMPWLGNVVMELTEAERLDERKLKVKEEWINRWNAQLALDDYGSGYNSEKMLLRLAPDYIKVDMAIIRGIDGDGDKQVLFSNIAVYAHKRGMMVIAEGVETEQELRTVIHLGADYIQGYWCARPQLIPPVISEEMTAQIRLLSEGPNMAQ